MDLDHLLADAVLDSIGLLERDPAAGYPLRGRLNGVWSLRIGVYRIIYELRGDGATIRVVAIRHGQPSLRVGVENDARDAGNQADQEKPRAPPLQALRNAGLVQPAMQIGQGRMVVGVQRPNPLPELADFLGAVLRLGCQFLENDVRRMFQPRQPLLDAGVLISLAWSHPPARLSR